MSGSRIITEDDDRLDNVHPGEDPGRYDFLIGSDIPLSEVAVGTGLDPSHLLQIFIANFRWMPILTCATRHSGVGRLFRGSADRLRS